MELLVRVKDMGLPVDYLLSRIRGKRTGLVSEWNDLTFSAHPLEHLASASYKGFVKTTSPEGLWRDLLKEYRWVYLRLSRALLEVFKPFFAYSELRTIFICLRHIKGGTTSRTGEVLLTSLLSAEIKDIFKKSRDVSSAVGDIEKVFLCMSGGFKGVAGVFERDGLGGFERELAVRYLMMAAEGGFHPLMKEFFVRIIDARNILSLYKFMSLQPGSIPAFIPLGSISESAFKEIIEKNDNVRLYKLAGAKGDAPLHSTLETILYRNITFCLRKAGREPFGIGTILDYLWRCSIEAMNLRVLSYGRDTSKDALKMELVY